MGLTLRLLKAFNQEIYRMIGLFDNQLLHETLKEVKHLLVLKVLLDVLLVFKFLDFVHILIIKTSYKFIS